MKSKILGLALVCSLVLPMFSSVDVGNNVIINAEETTINNMSADEYNRQVNTMISLVNEYRAENGLSPYKTAPLLLEMTQQRAKEQETTGTSHTRPDGSNWTTIFSEYSIQYTVVRENVGGGTYIPVSEPTIMLNQWQNSTGHNANLLSDCEYIGVGLTYYDNNCYWVQIFCNTNDSRVTDNAYIPNTSDITEYDPCDLNMDNKVSSMDLMLLKKSIFNLPIDETIQSTDINQDGVTNVLDVINLKEVLSK